MCLDILDESRCHAMNTCRTLPAELIGTLNNITIDIENYTPILLLSLSLTSDFFSVGFLGS